MTIQIYPSLISADLLNLEREIKLLSPHCDGFHIDLMDNHFVPNLTWGAQFVNAINLATNKPLFVHLMIDNPAEFIARLIVKPGSTISFHFENTEDIFGLVRTIRAKKLIASLAIKPSTDITALEKFLPTIDQLLLMSVDPGFSGQQFLNESLERLTRLDEYRQQHNLSYTIAMDGGINQENIHTLAKNGCEVFGIASAIFNTPDPIAALKELYLAAD